MTDQNSQFFAILTAVGEAKLANAIALGTTLTFAQMAVGDANETSPIPNRLQTKLINERRRAPLNQVKPDPANAGVIIAEQVIPETVGGWWVRELALYDADGDMVAVANCAPTYKPLLAQGSGRTQVIRINLIVSSTANIELKIDPSVVLATRAYVDEIVVNSLVQATEAKAGIAKIATQPLANAGTDDKTFLTPKKLFAAIFKAIGFTPVQQGGGNGQLDNKIYIGFDGARVKVAVDNTDMGNIVTDENVATEDQAGVAKRASQALANAGTDDKTFLTPKKFFAAIFKAIGYTPVRQGGGVGQLDNKIYIGFKGPRVAMTVDESDFGNIITDLDKASQEATDAGADDSVYVTPKKMRWGFQFIVGLNGGIVFPTWMGGFILQWGSVVLNDGTSAQVTFPVQFTISRLATWSGINMNIAPWAGTVPGSGTSGGTNTLANMVVSYNDNAGAGGVSVAWFALGK